MQSRPTDKNNIIKHQHEQGFEYKYKILYITILHNNFINSLLVIIAVCITSNLLSKENISITTQASENYL